MIICFRIWKTDSLSIGSLSALGWRVAEQRFVEEAEGPKKPQCQMEMLKEAVRSTSTLREMLREHTASANATWLGERQEPVQLEPLVGLEVTPGP